MSVRGVNQDKRSNIVSTSHFQLRLFRATRCPQWAEGGNTSKWISLMVHVTDGERPEWSNSGGNLSCRPAGQKHRGMLNHPCFTLLEQWVRRSEFPGLNLALLQSKDHIQPLSI